MSPVGVAPPARVFYGWWVALAFATIVFLTTGVRFTVGPFLKPIVSDLGLDRGSFSLVISLSLFLYGAFMPLVGGLVDRVGARLVCAGGGVLLAGSLALTARMTSYWEFLLYFGVLSSLGLAATGHVVASAILTRWFERRRGTAMSLLGAAGMAGMSALVPAVMWCILTYGWRASLLLMAVATLVLVLPLALLVLRDRPEDLGLRPDGAAVSTVTTAPALDRTTVSAALRVPAFWQLAIGLACCGFSMSLISSHAVPMLTDHGFHAMTASSAIGLLGLVSMGGGMGLGFLSDRVGRKPVLVAVYVLRTAAFVLLFFARDPAVLMVVAAFGGIGMSGSLAMVSALTADIFGRFSVGSIFGSMFLAHQVGAALGTWLGGALFDATGGYGAAFATAGALLLFAAGLSMTVRQGRQGSRRAGTLVTPRPEPRLVAGGR